MYSCQSLSWPFAEWMRACCSVNITSRWLKIRFNQLVTTCQSPVNVAVAGKGWVSQAYSVQKPIFTHFSIPFILNRIWHFGLLTPATGIVYCLLLEQWYLLGKKNEWWFVIVPVYFGDYTVQYDNTIQNIYSADSGRPRRLIWGVAVAKVCWLCVAVV